jgi:hypothetical protein
MTDKIIYWRFEVAGESPLFSIGASSAFYILKKLYCKIFKL